MSGSLLTLLDDIASTLDDVAIMTKSAMKKTSGIITDDLAVNVGQVDGVDPKEELPIVFKIFLGALVNKAIIIPFVLLLTVYSPLILSYILLLGGLYLCYEGGHKVHEKLISKKNKEEKKSSNLSVKDKVWGAIKTDFVLSIEIMVIAQSSIQGDISKQALVLSIIGVLVCILIYGLVAVLVKIDDIGLYLAKNGSEKLGMFLVNLMPKMMKFLGFVGTVAMFLVGGEIFMHHFHINIFKPDMLQGFMIGFLVGMICVGVIELKNKVMS